MSPLAQRCLSLLLAAVCLASQGCSESPSEAPAVAPAQALNHAGGPEGAVAPVKAPQLSPSPYFKNLPADIEPLSELRYTVPKSPGIILLVTDTLRPDHLNIYGYQQKTSPFIDSLGRAGVTFLNHVSNSTWTKTSMASILTGLFPSRHRVLEVNSTLDRRKLTIAESFKKAGYRTAAFIANPISGKKYGLTQGFDEVIEPDTHFAGDPPHAGALLAKTVRWLEGVQEDEPFFAMVLLFDAHDPYFPPNPWRQDFCANCSKDAITRPEREYRDNPPSVEQIKEMESLYDGEISFMDSELEGFHKLVTSLKPLQGRTTFALVADHGEAFGEHGVFEHAFHMWDEVVRTPFILSGAGISSRGYVADPTSHVDLYPTLLRLAGIPLPEGLQGQSLVHREGEPGFDRTRVLVNEVQMYGIHRVSMRDRSRKLVYHFPLDQTTYNHFYADQSVYPSVAISEPRLEYFDLLADPFERVNLYDPKLEGTDRLFRAMEAYRTNGGLEGFDASDALSEELLDDLKAIGYVD